MPPIDGAKRMPVAADDGGEPDFRTNRHEPAFRTSLMPLFVGEVTEAANAHLADPRVHGTHRDPIEKTTNRPSRAMATSLRNLKISEARELRVGQGIAGALDSFVYIHSPAAIARTAAAATAAHRHELRRAGCCSTAADRHRGMFSARGASIHDDLAHGLVASAGSFSSAFSTSDLSGAGVSSLSVAALHE